MWRCSVNHKMTFCLLWLWVTVDAPGRSRTKNFFTKGWTNLESELSMLKNNTKGSSFWGPFFQIHPSASSYSRLPKTHKHWKFIHHKHSYLRGFCCSQSKEVDGERWGLQTNFGENEYNFSCNFKVTWNKFKCLFAMKTFI